MILLFMPPEKSYTLSYSNTGTPVLPRPPAPPARALESLGGGATSDAAAFLHLSSGDEQHASVSQLAEAAIAPAMRLAERAIQLAPLAQNACGSKEASNS